jgi:DNA-binding CsgD family transcriptional regulator
MFSSASPPAATRAIPFEAAEQRPAVGVPLLPPALGITPGAPVAPWLAMALDEIDHGVLLLDEDGQALHVNHTARAELDAEHPLQLLGRTLRARDSADVPRLAEALAGAQRGLRKLVTLGRSDEGLSLAVVPLAPHPVHGAHSSDMPRATLVLLSRRRICERLSVQWFARCHELTPAEGRVLEALCDGLEPREVAEQFKVGLATVRTQIGSIRAKTGTDSIRDLVRQVALLPPMVGKLRVC